MAVDRAAEQRRTEQAFFRAISQLHLHAGKPSSRALAAEIGGMSHTTVNAVVTGKTIPSWSVVSKIVDKLGGDIDEFRQLWVEAREPVRQEPRVPRAEVSVFVSYAHVDDDATYGRIIKLVDAVANTYRSITGKVVGVFTDIESISPGDDWKDRILLGLSSSSIFLAFVSPAYLRSASCREELGEFLGFLDTNSASRLVIPLLYADRERIERDFGGDELWQRLSRLHWLDISRLRSVDPGTSEWILKADEIANRVDEVLIEAASVESTEMEEILAAESNSDEDSKGGMLEQMAELEGAIPDTLQNLERFSELMVGLGQETGAASPNLARAEKFAHKLVISNKLAQTLTPIADEMVEIADCILLEFAKWESAVDFALELAKRDPNIISGEGRAFVRSIWDMANTGDEALGVIEDLSGSVGQVVGFSKQLDRPLKKVQRACLRMADLRGLLKAWKDRLRSLEAIDPSIFESEVTAES